jgi:hypothetical protein
MPLAPDDEIRSREELLAFVRGLHQDFRLRGQEWENQSLDRYLEALAAWMEASDGWYRNAGKELPAGAAGWPQTGGHATGADARLPHRRGRVLIAGAVPPAARPRALCRWPDSAQQGGSPCRARM